MSVNLCADCQKRLKHLGFHAESTVVGRRLVSPEPGNAFGGLMTIGQSLGLEECDECREDRRKEDE
jgi:hypothetical protein